MATKYSADITQAITPSAADPSSAIKAVQLQREVTADALTLAGETIFEGYKGYKVEELKGAQTTEVGALQNEMNILKATDIAQKGEMATFTSKTEPAVLTAFKEKQQALAEARDQMPTRYREMMLRAEANLKSAIAANPGLANAFRAASDEVTGKKGLELYSVENLYDEIDIIGKKQAQVAASAAKVNEDNLKRFVKDVGPQVGEVAAAALYNTMSDSERVAYASNAVALDNAKKSLDDTLKAGGNALVNVVTASKAQFEAQLVANQITTFEELKKFGVSRAQIATGDIPESVRNNPAFRALLDKQTTLNLELLDKQYQQALVSLQNKAASSPVDASMARQAMSDLEAWRKRDAEFYSKGGSLSALASLAGDDNKLLTQRLGVAKSISEIFNIPPDVAQNLMASGDSKVYAQAVARYPKQAKALEYVYNLVNVATRGGSAAEWSEAVRALDKVRQTGATISTSKTEVGANLINFKELQSKVTALAMPDADMSSAAVTVGDYIRAGLVDGGTGQELLTKLGNVNKIIPRMPESEKQLLIQTVKNHTNDLTYGPVSHGDEAKKQFEVFAKQLSADPNVGKSSIKFTSEDGLKPLQLVAERSMKEDLPEQRQQAYKMYVGNAPQPSTTNNALSIIDQNIRIRASITGEDVVALRKEFITNFNTSGSITDSYYKRVAPTSTGVPLGSTPERSYTGKAGSAVVSPELQAQRDAEAKRIVASARTPEEKVKYITQLEEALKEKMSPETKAFLQRELELVRGN